jgi:hypothetical protein
MSSSDIVKHGIAASADSASLREWFRRYGLTKGHYLRGASSRRDALTSLEALGYGPRAAALEALDWERQRNGEKRLPLVILAIEDTADEA